MRSTVDVAIDAGQTGVRLAPVRDGSVLPQIERGGLAYGTATSPADGVLAALAGCRRHLTADTATGTVCIGLTSVLGPDTEYAALADGLLRMFDARRVLITGDVVTAHAGALGMRPGVVLAAGTGAIALGLDTSGHSHQVDGWGHLYGDAGGGFWIGRRGLDAAMRGFDGRAEPGALTARAADFFGGLAGLAERLYPSTGAVARVAAFARHVIELAGTDPTASAIVDEAAGELAATVAAAIGDCPDVSWTGRLLRGEQLMRRFTAALGVRCPQARLHEPVGDGLAGAALLAGREDLGIYTALVRTATR